MTIVIKEIDVKTTIEKNNAEMEAEMEAVKQRMREEIQQDIEQKIKADMEKLRVEHRTER